MQVGYLLILYSDWSSIRAMGHRSTILILKFLSFLADKGAL